MKGILCGSSLILLLTTVCAASSPGDSANGKRLSSLTARDTTIPAFSRARTDRTQILRPEFGQCYKKVELPCGGRLFRTNCLYRSPVEKNLKGGPPTGQRPFRLL